MLSKATVEAALHAELDDHLKNTEDTTRNSRNGYSRKRLQTEVGDFELVTTISGFTQA